MPNRKSRLFRELTRDELAAAVRRHFGAVDFTACLMDGGLFNTTYLLSLSDGGRYVLRAGPVNRQLLLPFELRLFLSEAAVYRLCRERGIPVPVVTVSVLPDERADDNSLDYRGYIITEYIDSLPMTSELISPDEKSVLRRELGEITARFNSIEGTRFGRVCNVSGTADGGYTRWSDWLESEFAAACGAIRSYQVFSERELDKFLQLPEKYRGLLDEVTTPRLVHADLWEGNVLVTPDKKHIAAIIDADRALFGDVGFELAGGWNDTPEFYSGWGEPPSGIDYETRRLIYLALYRLTDTYVYFAEYADPESGTQTRNKARAAVEHLMTIQ